MAQSLITERLILRPFELSDGGAVMRYLGDINVSRWLAQVPHPFSAADLKLLNDDGSSRWPDLAAITLDGDLVGAVILTDDLGYWIAPAYWGRGFATEAARAITDAAFADPDLAVIDTGYLDGNKGSARVLQKLGFVESGRSIVTVNSLGVEMPQIDMTLTRHRWEQAR